MRSHLNSFSHLSLLSITRHSHIGKRKCRAAAVDGDGVLIKGFSFVNDFSEIEGFVRELSDGDCVVIESAGNLWLNLYEAVEDMGVKAVLANPLKMKAIASAKSGMIRLMLGF